MDNLKAPIAELVGSYAFVFVGVGAVCVDSLTHGGIGLLGIALAQGMAFAAMVSVTGHISGGYLNPAVTIGALAGGKISFKNSIYYIIAQLLGAVLAAVSFKALFSADLLDYVHYGTPALAPNIGITAGVFIEAVLTFFLVFAVYGTAIDERGPRVGGLYIGLVITMDILAAGPLTGASMNPARTFGPALVSGFWENHLVYWVGPPLGGLVAAVVYQYVLGGFWSKK
ncbi:MAG: aquaporin [Bacteroidota bacterium]